MPTKTRRPLTVTELKDLLSDIEKKGCGHYIPYYFYEEDGVPVRDYIHVAEVADPCDGEAVHLYQVHY
jgi:hypothetical protein